MKVFFDTNVLIAEALLGEATAQILNATIAARWRIYANLHVLTEVRRVLVERLGFSERSAISVCRRIVRRSRLVRDRPSRHRVPTDPNDNLILQAALTAGADYLVTNDRHLLELHPYEGVQIVSIAQYHQILIDEGLLID